MFWLFLDRNGLIRLIYIAVASLIFALLMNVGLIDVKIGNVDISKAFTDIKPALVIGVLCGLVESKIGIQVYNKAVSLLVDNSEECLHLSFWCKRNLRVT